MGYTDNYLEKARKTAKRLGITPLAELEKNAIQEAVRKTDGDLLVASIALGVSYRTIYRKLAHYGLATPARERSR